jgi:hypothetical protein
MYCCMLSVSKAAFQLSVWIHVKLEIRVDPSPELVNCELTFWLSTHSSFQYNFSNTHLSVFVSNESSFMRSGRFRSADVVIQILNVWARSVYRCICMGRQPVLFIWHAIDESDRYVWQLASCVNNWLTILIDN